MSPNHQRTVSSYSNPSAEVTQPYRQGRDLSSETNATASHGAAKPTRSGSVHACARGLAEVHKAWSIVYERYVEKNLIPKNPFGIHTVPQAAGQNACVIHQVNAGASGSTLTLMGDSAVKLPLDSVYPRALDSMRWQGRGLVEVGLLASNGVHGARRGARTLFDMMRWAAHYTLHIGLTDIIIGVHPNHTHFYKRCFGFACLAQPTNYPLVNNTPVVPMQLAVRETLTTNVHSRGIAYINNNPIAPNAFQHRFQFAPEQLRGSAIEGFLAGRHAVAAGLGQASDTTASGMGSVHGIPQHT